MMINLHNSLIEENEKCVAVLPSTEVDMPEIYLFGRDDDSPARLPHAPQMMISSTTRE